MDLRDPWPSSHAPLVFVGVATSDAIALVPRAPGSDERVVAQDVVTAGGGPAATAAVAAARLGAPTAFVGAVGDDDEGDRILAGLQDEGVDTSSVRRVGGARSGASVIVVDAGRSTRAICALPGPRLDLGGDAVRDLVLSAAWVHVDQLGWGPVREVLTTGSGQRPRLSVDAGNPIAGFDPRGVALHVPTEQALRRTHGDLPVGGLLDAALAAGAQTVVVTRGGEGCVGASTGSAHVEVPAAPTRVVSTLGAGDVFHGALLVAVARGAALEEAMRFASVVAALSCEGLDGRSAIPDAPTALAQLRQPAR